MKKLVATTAFLALAGSAMADDDVKLDFDSFTLAKHESITFEFDLGDNGIFVTGFSFSGTYDDLANDFSWASDLLMQLTVGETTVAFGGWRNDFSNPWDFDGGESDLDGTYTHDGHGAFGAIDKAPGQVIFTNDFDQSGGHTWTNVSIIIHKVIPAPGALALLGLAGLAVRRRRRA